MQSTLSMKIEQTLISVLFATCAAVALATTVLMVTEQAPAVQLAQPQKVAPPAAQTLTAASVRAPTKA